MIIWWVWVINVCVHCSLWSLRLLLISVFLNCRKSIQKNWKEPNKNCSKSKKNEPKRQKRPYYHCNYKRPLHRKSSIKRIAKWSRKAQIDRWTSALKISMFHLAIRCFCKMLICYWHRVDGMVWWAEMDWAKRHCCAWYRANNCKFQHTYQYCMSNKKSSEMIQPLWQGN